MISKFLYRYILIGSIVVIAFVLLLVLFDSVNFSDWILK